MSARRVAIVQSSYIPWRGYLALIAACDDFVFLDSVQFTRRDWRSRNRIRTPQGEVWLTIPLAQRGNYRAAIDQMTVADPTWIGGHWRRIEAAYRKAPGFKDAAPAIESAYRSAAGVEHLSAINIAVIRAVCAALSIQTLLARDSDVIDRAELIRMEPTDRLVAICRACQAARYLSGPAAKSYLDEDRFRAAGVQVEWADYSGLQPYAQIHGRFEPRVSIVDTMLNLGVGGARSALEGLRIT